jgi:glycosyltransferase involved in cell wall biosynthesis
MIPELDISVVIASIGRDSLWPLLEQIEKDLTDLRFEVIVVLDNPNYVVDERTRQKFSSTKFITIKDKLGAAAAYQLGIEVSQGNFFRIFADDDIWILGSTQELLKLTEINSIIIGEVLLQDEIGQIKRSSPKKINQSGIVGSVYQTIIPWRRNPNYLTLTSMITNKSPYLPMLPGNGMPNPLKQYLSF